MSRERATSVAAPPIKTTNQLTTSQPDQPKTGEEQHGVLDNYQDQEGILRPVHQGKHQGAPLPANETARLHQLTSLGVLDTQQERRFDDITQLVCSIFKAPIAIVSLVDKDRQWFKSCVGLNCNQTDRKVSFCAWTLIPKNPEILVVPNATEDVR